MRIGLIVAFVFCFKRGGVFDPYLRSDSKDLNVVSNYIKPIMMFRQYCFCISKFIFIISYIMTIKSLWITEILLFDQI